MKAWLGTLALALLLATPSLAQAECPVLAPIGDKTVTEGQLLTFTATATDADAGQTLTFSLINLIPDGAAIDPVTGVFTWTPATGPAASDVSIQVADNATKPCMDSEIIHVTVLDAGGENQCPVLAPIGDKTVTEGQLLTFTATATDADAGQTLTFSLINLIPDGAAIDPATGVFTWTPANGPAASDVSIQVADNATTPCLDSEIIHVTVLDAGGENQCPVIAPIADMTVTEGQLLTFTATATDADAGQTITFSLTNLIPDGAAIDPATGVFTWTPSSSQGPGGYDVSVQATDNAATPCSVTEILHVIVSDAGGGENQCPVLAPIGDKTVTEGQLLTFTATATDADAGQTLTFSLINLIPDGAAIDPATGVFTWTPANGPAASDVTIQVADNATTPCLDSEIIHVTVLDAGGENQCPVLAPIGDKTVTEGQLLTFTATATDADAGQTLTFSLINLIPDGAAIDPATGVFTWTPANGPAASDVSIQVADNATTPCLDSEIIHVTVLDSGGGENQCPVLAPIGDKTVTEGQLLTFTATATDADAGQTLTFSLINLIPDGAAIDPATGVFTWTPANGPAASDVTIQVADNAATPCLDSEIIHVTVLDAGGGNQCPVLAPIGNQTVDELSLLTFTATATDPDAGQTLTFSLDPGFPTGATIDPSTGVFTWTPTGDQGPGDHTVVVRVTDNADPTCSDFESIMVTVNDAGGGENQCPVLDPIGDKTVTEGQLLTFTATATDADGDSLFFSLINLIPAGAAIDPATGVFTWTPANGPAASDVTIQVADNAATPCLDSEIIHVTVLDSGGGENTPPVVEAPDTQTVDEGQMLTFDVTATDADADSVALTISNLPNGASFTDNHNNTGTFTWTPGDEQSGTYTVTFHGDDGNGGTDTDATVITVNNVDEGADFETTAELIGALNPHRKFLCFRIRQSDAGFDLGDVDLSTLTLVYGDQSINALSGKTHLGCDGDDGDDGDDAAVALQGHGHGNGNGNGQGNGNDRDNGNGNGNGHGNGNGNGGRDEYQGGDDGDDNSCDDCGDNGDDGEDGDDCDASQLHACFSMDDIRLLVGDAGLQDGLLASEIHGTLDTGETFVATLGGKHLAEKPGNGNHNGLAERPMKLKVHPNPLNPKADINFTLVSAGHVRVALYDLQGRLVKTILDENRNAGDHTVSWDGASDRIGRVSSGVYFLRVTAKQGEAMQRVTVLK